MTTPEQFGKQGAGNTGNSFYARPVDPSLTRRQDEFKRRLQGDDPRTDPLFSPDQQRRYALFMRRLIDMMGNVNLTASEPAHDVPSFWSEPVDQFGTVSFPGGATTAWTTVAEYITSPGRWARIEEYGIDVSDLASGDPYPYDGTIRFRFRVGDGPVSGLSDFTEHRGSAQRPRRTFFLSSGSNDTRKIQFQARRAIASPDPLDVTLDFRGWTWRPLNDYEGPKVSQAQ